MLVEEHEQNRKDFVQLEDKNRHLTEECGKLEGANQQLDKNLARQTTNLMEQLEQKMDELSDAHAHLAKVHESAILLAQHQQTLLAKIEEISDGKVTGEPPVPPPPPSPEAEVYKVEGGPRRLTRSKLVPVKIKIENPMEGAIRCPHPACQKEQLGMYVAAKRCNVIMCSNHARSFFFCYHCKKEIPNGYMSDCSCPKKSDVEARETAQKQRTQSARENPITVDSPEK